jgi:hypothetical protein
MGVEERAEESSAKAGGSRKIIHVDLVDPEAWTETGQT